MWCCEVDRNCFENYGLRHTIRRLCRSANMSTALLNYVEVLKQPVPEPALEPELDDIDEKADTAMK